MARLNKFILALAAAVMLLGAHGGHQARALANPDGLTVSPAFQMVTIASGAAQQPVTFKITNNLATAQNVNLSVADFNALNESGGLFFVGTNPTALQKKYGLAKWVKLPQSQISLPPKQTVTVNGQILNLPDLSPGGHYGALMISLSAPDSKPGQVGIHPIASSLLFVTKPDGATHKLALSNVSSNRSLTKLPNYVSLRFHNDGNTHVVPRGSVSLINGSGDLVAKGTINEDSQIILPGNYRQYKVGLRTVADGGFGKYTLKVDFRFDGVSQFRSYQQSFRFVPAAYLGLLAVAGAVFLILAARFLFGKKNSKKD